MTAGKLQIMIIIIEFGGRAVVKMSYANRVVIVVVNCDTIYNTICHGRSFVFDGLSFTTCVSSSLLMWLFYPTFI